MLNMESEVWAWLNCVQLESGIRMYLSQSADRVDSIKREQKSAAGIFLFSEKNDRRFAMAEAAETAPAPPPAEPAAKKKKQSKKAAGATKSKKPSGPSVSELIVKAVSASKERSGVSLAALKKALAAGGYDVEKNNSRLKLALKGLVSKETLVQVKGSGASGSFKLNKKQLQSKEKAAPAAAKAKKPAAKKAAKSPKKPKKVSAAAKSPKKVAKKAAKAAKSPIKPKAAKAKKVAKSPAKKSVKPKAAKSPAKAKAAKPKVAKAKKAAPKKK
uniref:H15 domain-containing protein n=2 Tax=Xenopus tropicalis TaxID=8364 RepID=A0A6I8REY7_XENTR